MEIRQRFLWDENEIRNGEREEDPKGVNPERKSLPLEAERLHPKRAAPVTRPVNTVSKQDSLL